MDKHKEFCKELGNTRLEYTEEDREIRETLKEAMKAGNTEECKGMRAVQYHEYRQSLKKLDKFRKGNFGRGIDNSERWILSTIYKVIILDKINMLEVSKWYLFFCT